MEEALDRFWAMEVFVRIVETGSLSAAARELDTTQPSVSRQLRALEHRLKTQLLHRSTRHVSLTEAGRAYYEDCKRILSEAIAFELHHAADRGTRGLCVSPPRPSQGTRVRRFSRGAVQAFAGVCIRILTSPGRFRLSGRSGCSHGAGTRSASCP